MNRAYLIEELGRDRVSMRDEDSLLVSMQDPVRTFVQESMELSLKRPYESAMRAIDKMNHCKGLIIQNYFDALCDYYLDDVYDFDEMDEDEVDKLYYVVPGVYDRILEEMKNVAQICRDVERNKRKRRRCLTQGAGSLTVLVKTWMSIPESGPLW